MKLLETDASVRSRVPVERDFRSEPKQGFTAGGFPPAVGQNLKHFNYFPRQTNAHRRVLQAGAMGDLSHNQARHELEYSGRSSFGDCH